MPKALKRILQIFVSLIVIIILAAIAIPYFFKDEIVAKIKEDINKTVNARVDFKDVNLSLFRSFPDFSFQLSEFEIIGIEEFDSLKLVGAENIDFTLDLMSVFRTESPIEIHSFHLEKPEVNIKVLRNGKANYDITKVDSSATTASAEGAEPMNFLIKLKEYSIKQGSFVYDDKPGDIYVKIEGLDHSGSGQFTSDIYDIFTKTNIEKLTAKSGGITYLRKAKTDLDVILNADMNNMKFTLKENQIVINALKLALDGFVQLDGDNINMDLKYAAPGNSFKNFLSLIPSAYTTDFQDVQANGSLKFNGFVKGAYNAVTGQIPAFQIDLQIADGDFKYPDLPLGVSKINAQTRINSPSSDFDKMTVDVSKFNMELGGNPFNAVFKLKTPISDPDLDAKLNGIINLEELAKAFPMEGVETLNGLITSNLNIKTQMSAIDKQDYENIDMSGDLQIENMNYLSVGQPAVKIQDLKMAFNPKNVKLDNFEAQLGKSDIKARGTVDNILAYFSPEKTMKGDLVIRSNYFDANEWLSEEETSASSSTTNAEVAENEIFDRFDFTIDGLVGKINYDIYELDNTSLKGNITPNVANIESFYTKIGKSDFKVRGEVNNIFNYLFDNETLFGKIDLVSNFIDLNQFMVEEGVSDVPQAKTIADEAPELEPIKVPKGMNFDIDTDLGKVRYTNIDLKDIKGKMLIKDETVELKNCAAKTMGGSFTMDGSYNSQNEAKPAFDLKYKVNGFDFQEAFNKLNTFAKLAPIGKFITGKFNTTMEMSGTVGKDMYPELGTISIDGFIETLNGLVKGFKPIEEFANMLNVSELKTLKIQNTKNWFEVENGLVTLKDFDYDYKGIAMEIGGKHSLTNDMNYNIKAKIPRSLLEKNAVTAAANQGLKMLESEASKIGINIKASEFVNVLFNITGSMTNPKFKLNLLNAEGASTSLKDIAENVVAEAVDSVKTIAKENIKIVKDSVAKVIDTTKEDLRKKADAEIAKLMAEAEKQAKNIQDSAKKLSKETEKLGYENADKLIEEAGSNFLKKKGAEIAAKNMKQETDKKVNQIIAEGDKKAQAVIDNAEKQADEILKKYGLD